VTSVAGHSGQPPSAPAATQANAKEVQSLYSETIWHYEKIGFFSELILKLVCSISTNTIHKEFKRLTAYFLRKGHFFMKKTVSFKE
jgi:hypothetical protein